VVMKKLDPAVSTEVNQTWMLIATEATRDGDGLKVTLGLYEREDDGRQTPALVQSLHFVDGEAITAFAADIATRAGGELDVARACIMRAFSGCEGVLREIERDAAQGQASQSTMLLDIGRQSHICLFHDDNDMTYATLEFKDRIETWPLRSKGFKRHLTEQFLAQAGKIPGTQAMQDALNALDALAALQGPLYPTYVRLGEIDDEVHLDLADERWRNVRVDAKGWKIIDEAPVKFRRAKAILPLPVPVRDGSLADLRPFVNLDGDDQDSWILFVSCLVMTLRPHGPYPILIVGGEQGSAKSTLCQMVKRLVDPNSASLRASPREERDLVIAAMNGWVLSFDNLSRLPEWLSDALCRLSTGSGFATRKLYTDSEEEIFAAQRPIVMNAIEDIATRPDLLDRAVLLKLPVIDESQRMDEKTFWHDFDEARPRILGSLLDVVSAGLKRLPSIGREGLPRMADFSVWGRAIAEACGWKPDDFDSAYEVNRSEADALALDASPLTKTLRQLMKTRAMWEGEPEAFYEEMTAVAGEEVTRRRDWPGASHILSGRLKRLAPVLRRRGLDVQQGRTKDNRFIQITKRNPKIDQSQREESEV
jgi:hypothetical protein